MIDVEVRDQFGVVVEKLRSPIVPRRGEYIFSHNKRRRVVRVTYTVMGGIITAVILETEQEYD